jgi:predicted metal-dependent phosphoesterase TrpH
MEDLAEAADEEFMVREDLQDQEIHLLLIPHKEMMEELEEVKIQVVIHFVVEAEAAVLHKQELLRATLLREKEEMDLLLQFQHPM